MWSIMDSLFWFTDPHIFSCVILLQIQQCVEQCNFTQSALKFGNVSWPPLFFTGIILAILKTLFLHLFASFCRLRLWTPCPAAWGQLPSPPLALVSPLLQWETFVLQGEGTGPRRVWQQLLPSPSRHQGRAFLGFFPILLWELGGVPGGPTARKGTRPVTAALRSPTASHSCTFSVHPLVNISSLISLLVYMTSGSFCPR